jgi:integrin alpha FG-GAP repeat containing protein 1
MGVDGNDRVIAFGDFNGDQLYVCIPGYQEACFLTVCSLDLIAVGPDQQTLAVYLWDHGLS